MIGEKLMERKMNDKIAELMNGIEETYKNEKPEEARTIKLLMNIIDNKFGFVDFEGKTN